MEFGFTYYKCQACTSRVNCRTCGGELEARMLAVPGISAAEFQMEQHRAVLETGLDPDAVEDLLESSGVFLA